MALPPATSASPPVRRWRQIADSESTGFLPFLLGVWLGLRFPRGCPIAATALQLHHVDRPLPDLVENAPDALAQNTNRQQLHAAEKHGSCHHRGPARYPDTEDEIFRHDPRAVSQRQCGNRRTHTAPPAQGRVVLNAVTPVNANRAMLRREKELRPFGRRSGVYGMTTFGNRPTQTDLS